MNKFLFTMTAYPGQTLTLDDAEPIVRHPMGLPIMAGCDTAQDWTRVCSDTSSTKMQCLRQLRHSELQSDLEWVASNKLIMNISKTKCIVFGTNNFKRPRPQLNLLMNCVAVEQVEETKLLGVTLDCKLSWSKQTDSMVVNMARCMSVIKICF